MEFFAQNRPTTTISIGPLPTTSISVNPPGGTGTPTHPPHHHLPLPTNTFPSPENHYLHATHVGHTALWVVFALFTAGLLGVIILSLRVEKKSRIFHWLSALVLTIAMVSYFAMASGLGFTFVASKYSGPHAGVVHLFRQVYYARYIDWLLTTPLLLISLGFLAGLSPYDTLLAILADIFMIVTGLLAGVKGSHYNTGERSKWGFFAVSCAGFLVIWYVLITGGVRAAKQRSGKTRGLFYLLTAMTLLLWTGYPIVWGLSEGANRISVDAEIIAYAVHDVAAKLGFTFILLLIHVHGEDDTYTLPDWFVNPRLGQGLRDGRGNYGAIPNRDV